MIKIDKEKLREKLGINGYAECCGLALCILCVIIIIVLSCIEPLARVIFTYLFAIIAVVCSLGYLIYKLLL